MNVYGVTGWKNSGKTTLVESLVIHFTKLGMSVSTIKHAHHSVKIDQEGKDSHRHRAAGASQVMLASQSRWALMTELRDQKEPTLKDLLAGMNPVDLILIEGYKRDTHPKIETFRAAAGQTLIGSTDPTIKAVATDVADLQTDQTILDLNNTSQIADFILAQLGMSEPAISRKVHGL
ncbi:molybdopterin-guanine dinucleotide biosynthesis protein B [Yoonia sediminilitoris]|uniref:Molybdopterin guanine dinucleotide biosynthesis accessory protein MobB n=1 Tax=Yoonia sediminilitoris TaxID=1286148 RepID=A0A2T6K6H8_9RHOB|nr:molybdopterin-guanine dinucleotide biosynthesis protein B [Yoonia sediminilitoris]PUB10269.1 molybdopterin guanine dinucleotide biosynthesis accessory protein MobB [Yoonia sediminilitoris]RCW89777.1 molybdopterin guanine dinucleotide biosynthesis accessory protein MobB [Yoonia sediminilitoris]